MWSCDGAAHNSAGGVAQNRGSHKIVRWGRTELWGGAPQNWGPTKYVRWGRTKLGSHKIRATLVLRARGGPCTVIRNHKSPYTSEVAKTTPVDFVWHIPISRVAKHIRDHFCSRRLESVLLDELCIFSHHPNLHMGQNICRRTLWESWIVHMKGTESQFSCLIRNRYSLFRTTERCIGSNIYMTTLAQALVLFSTDHLRITYRSENADRVPQWLSVHALKY